MKILFITNDGDGAADPIDIPVDTDVEQLFADHVASDDHQDYLIRVNGRPAVAGQILQEGDRVSVTPARLEGAT